MTHELRGQVALVTGAGRGIGRGCALALAAAGARVIAVARSAEDLAEVAAQGAGRIETWCADVCSEDILRRVEAEPGLSILVNNAGGNRPQAFADVDTETLDFILALNVRAAFRVSQAAVRNMLAGATNGTVINMSSQMGHVGSPGRTVYCMTKHAIEGLTKAMAVELAPQGIRVNCVAPTFIATSMTGAMLQDGEFNRFVLERIPIGKIGTVADVVAAVMYLASPGAGMVTGHSLKVDGGWTAQ